MARLQFCHQNYTIELYFLGTPTHCITNSKFLNKQENIYRLIKLLHIVWMFDRAPHNQQGSNQIKNFSLDCYARLKFLKTILIG